MFLSKNIYNSIHIIYTNIYFLAFGKALLQCLACLLPFLDHDLIDNLSYLTASTISVLPMELHEEIVNYLCFYILPFTISKYFYYTFLQVSFDVHILCDKHIHSSLQERMTEIECKKKMLLLYQDRNFSIEREIGPPAK